MQMKYARIVEIYFYDLAVKVDCFEIYARNVIWLRLDWFDGQSKISGS